MESLNIQNQTQVKYC